MSLPSRLRPVTHASSAGREGAPSARRFAQTGETVLGMGAAGRLAVAASVSALVWSAIAFGLA